MQISAPFAYGDVEPVLKHHRIVDDIDTVPNSLRNTQALPISFAELTLAARDYPIVFVKSAEGPLRIVALVGLQPGQNLFVDGNGQWRADTYRPAYLRRHPFCMATVQRDGEVSGERVVCVESAKIAAENGRPITDEHGEPLPWWQQTVHFLTEYEADLLRTEKVCDVVEKNGLLEPFSAQAVGRSAELMNLSGMYRISETRLANLKADTLRMLITKGVMTRLYAHMISLDRFARLLDLHSTRMH
jgi:SapC protein